VIRGPIRRDADQSRLPAGVEGVTGDLNRPETLRAPVAGVRAVFLLNGYEDMPNSLAEMGKAGVKRVVCSRVARLRAAT
jgi:uncharacterized protein YbjT (DUF2867 family)